MAASSSHDSSPVESESTASVDVLHLDMDSFFAAVEILADPTLVGRAVVVGGTGPRGVVASASYTARTFGVRSAMPIGEARRLCPSLVVVAPRHDEYARTSTRLMGLCREITPTVEPISLDEAFLDVSGAHQLFGTSEQIAWTLRERVRDTLELDCAIGVGRTKLIAKLASKAAKPVARPDVIADGPGVLVVPVDEELAFLLPHPVRALPGVGPRTAERLRVAGVSTVGDLALIGNDQLISMFGASHGASLFALSRGGDDRTVVSDREIRSIGNEETFDTDDFDRSSLESKVRELAVGVASRCRAKDVGARTISIKIRFSDFETIVRSRTERHTIVDARDIASIATNLLDSVDVDLGVRLIGVSVSNFESGPAQSEQLGLFDESREAQSDDRIRASAQRESAVEVAADKIRDKFGRLSITSAAAANRRADHERSRMQTDTTPQ